MKTTKMNAKKRLSQKARGFIQNAINTHEHYKGSYFWKTPSTANQRRGMENAFSGKDFSLETKDGTIEVTFDFSVSCKNVYYSMNVYLNEEKKDIRILRKLLK
jgi:hypothetical protein